MYKYCKCPFVVGEHALTQDHVNWVRQKQRERAQERPLNTNDLVLQTMRISLADSDTDPTLSDRPSGGADILSAVMDSFDAVLSQARASRPKPKQATRNEQSDDLLRAILRDIEAAIRPLDPAHIASLNLDLQWQAVDTAAEELAISAKALQAFDEETEEKAFVVRQLRILENSVGRLREDLPSDTRPYYYDCEYVFQDPMANIDIVAQLMVLLGLVCNLIMNMSRNSVEFILRVVTMMIKYTMLIPPSKPQKAPDNESYTDMQQHIIDQLPTSFHDAMSKLNLDGKTVLYAACPSCEHVHAPTLSTSKEPTWPATCENIVVRKEGRSVCGKALLNSRKKGARPIKPFLSPCFLDYLACLTSDPETEKLLEDAYELGQPTASSASTDIFTGRSIYTFVRDIFKGRFLQNFKGRDNLLFIDPGPNKRLKLVFGFSLDFFPPFGSRNRSGSNSIGLLAIYCLNFQLPVRYVPEHMHISIITGKAEPLLELINPYLRPTVDVSVIAWERGIRLSRTALCKNGRILEVAFPLSVNDLPVARKISGTTGHQGSHLLYCL
ncbi:hypothetical protein C8R44DRAFT_895523 [Mycena epipterygia]|nr:hypothetical protein C8R44DRAFT_895523 [Mycena epipterygia]